MQYTSAILLSAAGLLSTVSAHGAITSPTPRAAGEAMKAACGEQVFYNQASDSFGNIQGELQVATSQADYNAEACNIWQCKGYQFADVDAANIQSWTAGQVVPFTFDVRAPHAGTANVSIINTATNTIIGSPLITYSDFGNNAYAIPANQTSFSITIPSDLGSTCATAGACVVQHYWDARSIDQTYESCVDFTVGGSGSSAPVASSAAPIASSAASVPVATSAAVEASITAIPSTAPTTLQTLVRPSTTVASTTEAATPIATPAPVEEEDDCE
ncbi:hypothetical protein ONS95_002605 [Cadophora gregata]|uniref:uncharacterized protein n=1 Tax=Cadophora gregata TaxID=51156 RepID=UPI0026DA7B17|nr:uncharacterized protein ONS95_002605 [Cadophora gregata]KAK0109937.1 hypothetical protein ONS95_002605 [Cadophora gregata]KAK0110435.1 hypothetical protein ONS96_002046 [Cadophora gregata f. sp. sojae]